MGEYVPLYISVLTLVILGGILPPLILAFEGERINQEIIDGSTYIDNPDLYNSSVDMDAGRQGFSDTISMLDRYWASFNYIPDVLFYPLLIITSLGFAYTAFRAVTLA